MDTPEINSRELTILRHALGLCRDGRGQQTRNYYISGDTCADMSDCLHLVELGLMAWGKVPNFCSKFNRCFEVTGAGMAVVEAAAPPSAPHICMAGTLSIAEGYDPDSEEFDCIEDIDNSLLVRFPDADSMKEVFQTGNIPPCAVFQGEVQTSIWEVMPGVEIRATAEALADQNILDWVTVTTKRGRRAYERGEW